MQHDADAALEHLRLVRPGGPWALVAIDPNKKGLTGATFGPDSEKNLRSWLDAHKARNVYFHLNQPTGKEAKASRVEILEVSFLHADLDPRAGEELAGEQLRIRNLLDNVPAPLPPPTGLVFSGGGYQAVWALRQPIPVNGDLAAAEEAKLYNVQIELLLGGDNCHNIDRIMRVAGTINWPDERKRLKGRTACRAEMVWYHPERIYDVAQFSKAAKVQLPGPTFGGMGPPESVEIPSNVQFLDPSQIHDLPVSDRTKMLIVQGCDPDEPNRWESRSELLFHVCCELVRANLPNETIYALITDPDLRISASVLDKKDPQRYATRQIKQAREDAIDPWLAKLNQKFAVIGNLGGKCRVVEEVMDHALGRPRLTKQSFEDFRNRFLNVKIILGKDKNGDPVKTPAGKWWLEHEQRRQFDTIMFAPNKDLPDVYNLWQGFAVPAKPNGLHESYLRHVHDNICSGSAEVYEYVVRWMARAVQHPDSPGQVCIALRGKQGTGKSFFAKVFGELFGRHFMQISDPKHLVGSFNAHLRDCVVMFADEAFYAGDNKHKAILKALITEEYLVVEAKGVDAEVSPNYIHLIMASNSNWIIPADSEERRYLVLDVGELRMQDHSYFEAIRRDLDAGGRESLLHYLMNVDLKGYEVRDFPRTEALREQKLLSLSPEEEWWFRKLTEGSLLPHHLEWGAPLRTSSLLDDYLLYTARVGVPRRATATALGRFLHKACPDGWPRSHQREVTFRNEIGVSMKERAYFYEFPTLQECRDWWDAKYGGPHEWTAVEVRHEPRAEEVF